MKQSLRIISIQPDTIRAIREDLATLDGARADQNFAGELERRYGLPVTELRRILAIHGNEAPPRPSGIPTPADRALLERLFDMRENFHAQSFDRAILEDAIRAVARAQDLDGIRRWLLDTKPRETKAQRYGVKMSDEDFRLVEELFRAGDVFAPDSDKRHAISEAIRRIAKIRNIDVIREVVHERIHQRMGAVTCG